MLQSANIPQNKRDILMTTLTTFYAENMRNQTLRLFCEEQAPVTDQFGQLKVKVQHEERASYVLLGLKKKQL